MANSIEYAQKFTPIIDDIYKAGAVTTDIDSTTNPDFTGVKTVQVLKVSTTGLGDYDPDTGYPAGDVTAAWETLTLAEDRGKELSVDRMANEEALGVAFGQVTGEFMRLHVIPELDAYRFAKYASTAGISTVAGAVLTAATVLAAIDESVRQMDEDEVAAEGRRLYINSDLKPILSSALTRTFGSDGVVNTVLQGYNNMPIKWVPKNRFFTSVTLNSGESSWGYVKTASTGKNINFMIIHPSAVVQVVKFSLPKIFDPDTNQKKDSWLFQFREYHDAFVYENKVKGVYLHKSTI